MPHQRCQPAEISATEYICFGFQKIFWKNIFFASLKSMKKGVGSGSGSISQSYGSGNPDPHQNVTDPRHWSRDDWPVRGAPRPWARRPAARSRPLPPQLCNTCNSCEPVLRIRIRAPVPFWPLDPKTQTHIFESLVIIFWVKSSIFLWKLAQIFFFNISKLK